MKKKFELTQEVWDEACDLVKEMVTNEVIKNYEEDYEVQ